MSSLSSIAVEDSQSKKNKGTGIKLTKDDIKRNQEEFMRPDPQLDRYIIEGMLSDPDQLIQ
jgi:hypothetical protein